VEEEMQIERYQVRERENSKWFPFAVIDTLIDYRAVALAANEEDAEREAERLNAMEEFHASESLRA
jgi:hypothetical protein